MIAAFTPTKEKELVDRQLLSVGEIAKVLLKAIAISTALTQPRSFISAEVLKTFAFR